MIKNYLVIAIRNLLKHKIFSIINIFGLAIGMASAIIIFKFISYESSYDEFNKNNSVYRLVVERYQNGVQQFCSARSYPGFYKLVLDNLTDVKECVRVYAEDCLFKYNKKIISGQAVLWADNSFIKIFDVKLLNKSSDSPLNNTFTTIISQTAAKRLFGNDNPLGKIIILNEGVQFLVTGVFEDYPVNSHIKFDYILSMNTLAVLESEEIINTQYYNWLYNYVLLKPDSDYKKVEVEINRLIEKRFGYLKDDNSKIICKLQPLTDIHLKSHLSEEMFPNSDIQIVYYLGVIAIIILFMAWINYVNLSTARAMERGSEVGIRKVVGADKKNIVFQFLLESLFVGVIAFGFAILFSYLLSISIKSFSSMADLYLGYSSFYFWLSIIFVFVLCGVSAGIYPALLLSSFKPNLAIKGRFKNTKSGIIIRKFLVVFQFTAAIVLLASTIIVYQQISYVKSQQLGFSKDQVLVVNTPRSLINNNDRVRLFEIFKERLLKISNIQYVSASDVIPGKEIVNHLENFARLGSDQRNISYLSSNIDRDYFSLLDIKLAAGRSFQKDIISDSNAIIINKKAKKLLGFSNEENVIGKYVINLSNNQKFNIVGVVENYHQEHLKKNIEPIIYFQGHNYQFGYFPIKLKSSNIEKTVDDIKNIWEQQYPNDPFDYFFLDDFFNAQYKADKQFGETVLIFSALSICIALLGLFGLSTLTATQKTKEIGIRKALGASVINIIISLSKEFLSIVLFAIIISIPIIYFLMNNWLDSFTVKITLNVFHFIVPAFATYLVALLTISIQIVQAALVNPVDSLRYE